MKEHICMMKRCPLRRQHKETKVLYCTVSENAQGYYLQKVVAVNETECISRRMEVRKEAKHEQD